MKSSRLRLVTVEFLLACLMAAPSSTGVSSTGLMFRPDTTMVSFQFQAQGSPEVWNAEGQTLYWGKRAVSRLRTIPFLPLAKRDEQAAFFHSF